MTQTNENLPKLGTNSYFTVAQLEDLQSPANAKGDTRLGRSGTGKIAGREALLQLATTISFYEGGQFGNHLYIKAMALGPNSSDAWCDPTGVTYMPLNLSTNPSDYALTNMTYSAGLLTSSNTSNSAVQVVDAMSAGNYQLNGKVGNTAAAQAVRITVTGSVDGLVMDRTYNDAAVDPTNVATINLDDELDAFTLSVAQNVTVTLEIVTAGTTTGAAGSGTVAALIFEAD